MLSTIVLFIALLVLSFTGRRSLTLYDAKWTSQALVRIFHQRTVTVSFELFLDFPSQLLIPLTPRIIVILL